MPATHRRRRTGGLALAVLAALATAAPAGAATGPAAPAGRGAHLLSEVAGAEQRSALEYWTPERMAAARPASADAPAAQGTAQDAPEGTPAGGSAAPAAGAARMLAAGGAPVLQRRLRGAAGVVDGAVGVATPWTGPAAVTPKVGRLYFTQGGVPYECSASSVRAGNESVVVTAGHCLTEKGRTSTNVIFVPGLAGSAEPFGRWSATRTFTTQQWRDGDQDTAAALNFDVGFVVVGRQGGATLADRVGAFDLGFDAALERVTVFGYPAASRTSDGYTLQHCTGLRFPDDGGTTDQGTLCDMGGGSSGGPWLSRFDPAAGTGVVTSVVSFSYGRAPDRLYGPRLGSAVRAVYKRAAAA
ncbi:trypsin-like serine peptidase [Kineococcus sp. SYSU DK005]|uniref:trypsin-like serine peptidase n=1 Tax=Kineococcus sp. SYSU DK005 TaxID=3383126 RepID=UPI003D7D5655